MFEEVYKKDFPFLIRKITINDHVFESKLLPADGLNDDDLSRVWIKNKLIGKKTKHTVTRKLNIVDLCSSVGGLSLGTFEAARALSMQPNCLFAADTDKEALETYKKNFNPKISKNLSISKLVDFTMKGFDDTNSFSYEPTILDEDLLSLKDNVDILVAGPPCQGHSNLNNKTRGNDPRNNLYLDVVAIGVALKVKKLVIENVRQVTGDQQNVVNYAKKILNEYGYQFVETVINAHDVGGGQTRVRHFLIATLDNKPDPSLILNGIQRPILSLGDVIGLKPYISINENMLRPGKYSEENITRINYLFDHDLYDLPDHVRPDCHKDGDHNRPAVYGRLYWDKPSPTITTGFMSPGRGRYVHPKERRALIPHEAARIQGFADSFQFNGGAPTKLAKWIGDAVPFSLAYTSALIALSSTYL